MRDEDVYILNTMCDYEQFETLIHELIHLSEEEMVNAGLIQHTDRLLETRVEAMGVHITRYLVSAGFITGLGPEHLPANVKLKGEDEFPLP